MEIRVSIRRGNALAKLNRVSEAIQEYERALKLEPNNDVIKRDLETLRRGTWYMIDFVFVTFLIEKIISFLNIILFGLINGLNIYLYN